MHPLLERHRREILEIAARHGARNVRVFGSFAAGDPRPDSDVDLLVELDPGRSLFDQIDLKHYLEELLARRVEVAEPEGIHWYIRDRVLAGALPL